MTRCIRLLCSALVSSGILVLATSPAVASEPAAASGSGTEVFVPTGFRMADGNTIVGADLHGTVTGTLSGTWSEHALDVIHADGSQTTHAFGTFTVTTPCGTGSFPFELEAQQPTATSNLTGQWRSIDQNGAKLSIHTVDTFTTAPFSGVFSYSGTYHC